MSFVPIFVDQTTHFTWLYALKLLNQSETINCLKSFVVDAGAVPPKPYRDFDVLFLEAMPANWIENIIASFEPLLLVIKVRMVLLSTLGRPCVQWPGHIPLIYSPELYWNWAL